MRHLSLAALARYFVFALVAIALVALALGCTLPDAESPEDGSSNFDSERLADFVSMSLEEYAEECRDWVDDYSYVDSPSDSVSNIEDALKTGTS